MIAPRVVFFEGIPGSGKTTVSQAVRDVYASRDIACGWALEEAADHPFFGREVRRRHREPDYDELCVSQWERLVEESAQRMWFIEGAAMQSTVRFMFERCWPVDRIEAYWDRFAATMAPTGAALIRLTQRDPAEFVRTHTMEVRAPVWAKIAGHVESTPVGRALAGEGVDVPVEFWVRYEALCRRLVERGALRAIDVDVSDGWAGVCDRVVDWIDDLPGCHVPLASRAH